MEAMDNTPNTNDSNGILSALKQDEPPQTPIREVVSSVNASLPQAYDEGSSHWVRGGTFDDDNSVSVRVLQNTGMSLQLEPEGSSEIVEVHVEEMNELVRAHQAHLEGLHDGVSQAEPRDEIPTDGPVAPPSFIDPEAEAHQVNDADLAADPVTEMVGSMSGGPDRARFMQDRKLKNQTDQTVQGPDEMRSWLDKSKADYGLSKPKDWPSFIDFPPKEFKEIFDNVDLSKFNEEQLTKKMEIFDHLMKQRVELMKSRANHFDDWILNNCLTRLVNDKPTLRERVFGNKYDIDYQDPEASKNQNEQGESVGDQKSEEATVASLITGTGKAFVRKPAETYKGIQWACLLIPERTASETGVKVWSHDRVLMNDGGEVISSDGALSIPNRGFRETATTSQAVAFMVNEMKSRGRDTVIATGNPEYLKMVAEACQQAGMGAELRRPGLKGMLSRTEYVMPRAPLPPETVDVDENNEVKETYSTTFSKLLTSMRMDPDSQVADALDNAMLANTKKSGGSKSSAPVDLPKLSKERQAQVAVQREAEPPDFDAFRDPQDPGPQEAYPDDEGSSGYSPT